MLALSGATSPGARDGLAALEAQVWAEAVSLIGDLGPSIDPELITARDLVLDLHARASAAALGAGERIDVLTAAIDALGALWITHRLRGRLDRLQTPLPAPTSETSDELTEVARRPLQPLTIEVGIELIPLLNDRKRGDLVTQIQTLRRSILEEMGWSVPPVHLRDNLQLDHVGYRILLREEPVARGILMADRWLATNPSGGEVKLEGEPATDRWTHRQGTWIGPGAVVTAQRQGYVVRSPSTVLAEHLATVIRGNAHEIYGSDSLGDLMASARRSNPEVLDALEDSGTPFVTTLGVVRELLRERVTLSSPHQILAAIASASDAGPERMRQVREALAPRLVQRHLRPDGALPVIGISEPLADALRAALRTGRDGHGLLLLSMRVSASLQAQLSAALGSASHHDDPVLVAPAPLRRPLQMLFNRQGRERSVLSPAEIPPTVPQLRTAVLELEAPDA